MNNFIIKIKNIYINKSFIISITKENKYLYINFVLGKLLVIKFDSNEDLNKSLEILIS